MGYFRPLLDSLEPYVPGWQPASMEGVIKLNANENAYPPSLELEDKLHRIRMDDLRYYPDALARDFRRTLAALYGVTPDNIFVGNGGDEVLRLIVQAVLEPGDTVTIPYPSYVLYRTLAEMAEARVVEVDLTEDFQLSRNFTDRFGKLVFLCSPNNPTGNCLRRESILQVLEAARDRCIVVVDEAYVDFSGQNCIPLIREFDNLLVLRSLSKSYSLAGLRVGVAVAHYEIISALFKLKDSYNVDVLAQVLGQTAVMAQEAMKINVGHIRQGRELLSEGLSDLGFRVVPSDANFVLTEPRGIAAPDLQSALQERKILVRYFRNERRLENCLRISVGREDEIRTLLAAIREILNGDSTGFNP